MADTGDEITDKRYGWRSREHFKTSLGATLVYDDLDGKPIYVTGVTSTSNGIGYPWPDKELVGPISRTSHKDVKLDNWDQLAQQPSQE